MHWLHVTLHFVSQIQNPLPTTYDGTQGSTAHLISNVLKVIYIGLGSISVLMVTVGGFMYITSDQEPRKLKSAKDTILYAIIGLFVALGAWGIVTFVMKGLFS